MILAAFEQEFVYTGVEHRPGATYSLDAHRRQGTVRRSLHGGNARRRAQRRDSFLPEYGARQYEVTIHPTSGVRAADEAVIQREMARAVAQRARLSRDLLADPRPERRRQRHPHPFQPARRRRPAGVL